MSLVFERALGQGNLDAIGGLFGLMVGSYLFAMISAPLSRTVLINHARRAWVWLAPQSGADTYDGPRWGRDS